eukprot:1139362-Pelagomonas_calceolata.AAC.1
MTADISVCPCPPVWNFEHEGWTRLVRYRKGEPLPLIESRHVGIILRVEWFSTLRRFHWASDTAEARPCPGCADKVVLPGLGRIVDGSEIS